MCDGSLSPRHMVCDSPLRRRAVEDVPYSSAEGWSEPNKRLRPIASLAGRHKGEDHGRTTGIGGDSWCGLECT